MARKKNRKKQQKRKQAKQQRRKARVRRKTQRSKPQPTSAESRDEELLNDIQPFWSMQGDTAALPDVSLMQRMIIPMLDSDDLAEEPEFDNIVFDPLQCVNTFAAVGEEMGVDPAQLDTLSEEERGDVQYQIFEESTRRLLTDELKQDVIASLNALRLRLKREGQPDETARVATLQSFLTKGPGDEFWPMLGVVHAIVRRSMAVGFELAEASAKVLETGDIGEDDQSLVERLKQAGITQQTENLLGESPGIASYLRQQVNQVRVEGMEAIYAGDLYLELFTQDELETAAELMAETLGYDSEADTQPEITQDTGRNLMMRMEEYLTGILTPQRLDQLRERLTSIVNEEALEGKWLGFVLMLREDMEEEDAVENNKAFLMRALFGEMRRLEALSVEDDD